MRSVSLQLKGVVVKMVSLSLNEYIMSQKGVFWNIGNTNILVYYLIVSSQNIEVYRFKTMDVDNYMLTHWFQWNMKMNSYQ